MERVVNFTSSDAQRLQRFQRTPGTAVTGYIAIALLLLSPLLARTAEAAVYIGGSPATTIVAHSNYYFRPWLAAPKGDRVTFSIANKPYWAHFDTTSGTLTGAVYAGNVGTYQNIRISASDGRSSSSMPVFAIAVVASATTTPPPPTPPPTNPPPVTTPPTTAATLQLSAPSYSVAQNAGALTVQVNRVAGSSGAASVKYATADASAVAGTDYTAVSGTLTWANGETATKSFSVPVSNALPFTGTKNFRVALSNPSTGATVGTPNAAAVSIAGDASPTSTPPVTTPGVGAPSAVSNLQLINQGGPNVGASPPQTQTNVQQISWSAATPGAKAISYYRIYRNGAEYATTTGLTFTDSNAPGSVDPAYGTAATTYSYDVTAVDTAGTEGPKSGLMTAWTYRNGVSNWGNYDLSWGNIQENYAATGGGTRSVGVLFVAGGFQPTVHPPQAPIDNLEIGAFKYFTIDVNPGPVANYNHLSFGTVSRLPPGDVFGWHPTVNVFDYGPAPKANTWATYKIPLSAVAMGSCEIMGSITGNQLTVTSIVSGDSLTDNGGFVTGPGVPAGTYIIASGQNAATGTFTVAGPGINGSTRVASTKMTYRRTSLYKFALFPDVGNTTIYFNNMGFTAN